MTRQTSKRGFWTLLAATVLVQSAVFAGRPMTSYRALELGADTLGVGLVVACFAALPLVLAIPAGRGVDGNHAIGLLRTGAVCTLVGPLVMAAAGSLPLLAVGNVVAGTGLLLSAVSAQGLIARDAAQSDHDRAFGLFTVAASVGQLVGPLVSGLVAHLFHGTGRGSQAGLASAAVLGVALVSLTLTYRDDPAIRDWAGQRHLSEDSSEPGASPGVATMLRARGMQPAMLASLSLLTAVDLITAFLPVLAEDRGISAATVGWLLALRALASIASRLLVARLAQRWGRRAVLTVSMLLAAAMILTIPTSSATGILVLVMLVAGFTLGIGQPLTMSWVTTLVPPRSRATALAVRLSANRVGQVVVPATAGAVAGAAGPGGVFVLTASLLTVASAGVLTSRPVRATGDG